MKKFFKRFLCMAFFAVLTVICAHADTSVVMVHIGEEGRPQAIRNVQEGKKITIGVSDGGQTVDASVKALDEGRRFAVLVLDNDILKLTCGCRLNIVVTDKFATQQRLLFGHVEAIATICPRIETDSRRSSMETSGTGSVSVDIDSRRSSMDPSGFSSPLQVPSVVGSPQKLMNPNPPVSHVNVRVVGPNGEVTHIEGETAQDVEQIRKALDLGFHRRHSV